MFEQDLIEIEKQRLQSGFYRLVPIEELEVIRKECVSLLLEDYDIPELETTLLQEGATDETIHMQLMDMTAGLSEMIQSVESVCERVLLNYCLVWLLSRSVARLNDPYISNSLRYRISSWKKKYNVDMSSFLSGSSVIANSPEPSQIPCLFSTINRCFVN